MTVAPNTMIWGASCLKWALCGMGCPKSGPILVHFLSRFRAFFWHVWDPGKSADFARKVRFCDSESDQNGHYLSKSMIFCDPIWDPFWGTQKWTDIARKGRFCDSESAQVVHYLSKTMIFGVSIWDPFWGTQKWTDIARKGCFCDLAIAQVVHYLGKPMYLFGIRFWKSLCGMSLER